MSQIFLNQHFFDFTPGAEYFRNNDEILDVSHKAIIGLAFYHFDFADMIELIEAARSRCQRLIVYIKEPFSADLIRLLQIFQQDPHIRFFGDAVLNVDSPNWQPAISWFVSPRHYYQQDNWAKDLLHRLDHNGQDRPYQFDCLLGTQKSHRDVIAEHYSRSKLQHHILFNYFKNDIRQGVWHLDIGRVNQTWEPMEFLPGYHIALSALVPFEIYNQSYHSIVAESTAFDEFNHLTEKIAKPMLAKRVFVVFAGQYYLRSLRSLGFQTFSDMLDESYDLEPQSNDRYQMAWQQVERLCLEDSGTVRRKVQTILDHNQRLFLDQDWHSNVKQHIEQCKHQLDLKI